MEPKIIKEAGPLALIQIHEDQYCVQIKSKNLFGTESRRYIKLDRRGKHIDCDGLCEGLTIADYETVEATYNANLIKLGLMPEVKGE